MAYVSALRQIVEQEIVRHEKVMDNCASVVVTLESLHSRDNLRTVHFLRDDLGRSSRDLRAALDRLSQFLATKTAASSRSRGKAQLMDQGQEQSKKNTAKRTELSYVKGELARSRIRLRERGDQIAALIEDGLRVSFEKEVLEKQIVELRKSAGATSQQSSSGNNFAQGGGFS